MKPSVGGLEKSWLTWLKERTLLSIIELDLILFSLQSCWKFCWNFVNRMIVLDEWWRREEDWGPMHCDVLSQSSCWFLTRDLQFTTPPPKLNHFDVCLSFSAFISIIISFPCSSCCYFCPTCLRFGLTWWRIHLIEILWTSYGQLKFVQTATDNLLRLSMDYLLQ